MLPPRNLTVRLMGICLLLCCVSAARTAHADDEKDRLIEILKKNKDDPAAREMLKLLLSQQDKYENKNKSKNEDDKDRNDEDSIPTLIKALSDTRAEVRRRAAVKLVALGAPAVEPLIRILTDKQSHFRETAARLLGKIGDKRAAKPLAEALRDSNLYLRRAAAEALITAGDRRVVGALVTALADRDANVRTPAAKALANIGAPTVKPLIDALKSDDHYVRACAAYVLGRVGDKRTVKPLLITLKDKHGEVCTLSAEALGNLGDKQAVEPLIAAVKTRNVDLREAAAGALGKLGDKRAVEPLIALLKDRRRLAYRARQAAAEALGKLGDPKAVNLLIKAFNEGVLPAADALGKIGDKRAVEPLIKMLEHRSRRVRNRAAAALGELGDKRAYEPLAAMLKNIWPQHRNVIIRALGKIGDKRALELLLPILKKKDYTHKSDLAAAEALGNLGDLRAVVPLAKAISATGRALNDEIRPEVARAIRKMGPAAINLLIAASKDKDPEFKQGAAVVLGLLGDNRAVAPLGEMMKDENTAYEAANALKNFGADGVGPLIEALGRENFRIPLWAADALVKIGAPAVEPAIAALKSPSVNVRKKSAELLGKIGDKRSFTPLTATLRDRDGDVRGAAALALGKLGDRRAVPVLIAALAGKDAHATSNAAEALGKLGDARAVPALIRAMKSKFPPLRKSAAEALGKLGDKRATKALTVALNDDEVWVQKAAADALKRLGSTPTSPEGRAVAAVAAREWDKAAKMGATAVPPLIEALKKAYTTRHIERALSRIGAPAVKPLIYAVARDNLRVFPSSIIGPMGKAAFEPLIELLGDENRRVRQISASTLRSLNWKPTTPQQRVSYLIACDAWNELPGMGDVAFGPLVAALKDKHPATRATAAITLGELGDKRAVALLKPMLKDENYQVRASVAGAMGKLAYKPSNHTEEAWYLAAMGRWEGVVRLGSAAYEPLMSALKSKDPQIQAIGAGGLAVIKDKRAVEPLIAMLKEPDIGWGARAVVEALGMLADKRAVKPLIALLGSEKNNFIRSAAINSLRQLGPAAVDAAIKAMKDENKLLRDGAIDVLANNREKRVQRILIRALADMHVGKKAARALYDMGWQPKSDSELVHLALAVADERTLTNKWDIAKKVLLADIRIGGRMEIENAVAALLKFGKDGSLGDLSDLLKKHGSRTIAEVYLEQKNEKLTEAVSNWAEKKGYKITPEGALKLSKERS